MTKVAKLALVCCEKYWSIFRPTVKCNKLSTDKRQSMEHNLNLYFIKSQLWKFWTRREKAIKNRGKSANLKPPDNHPIIPDKLGSSFLEVCGTTLNFVYRYSLQRLFSAMLFRLLCWCTCFPALGNFTEWRDLFTWAINLAYQHIFACEVSMTPSDLFTFVSERMICLVPHIWVESGEEQKAI